jgi:hypothetical protein
MQMLNRFWCLDLDLTNNEDRVLAEEIERMNLVKA